MLKIQFIYILCAFRLGLKGPVYLKEKDGKPHVPLSLISGKSSGGKLKEQRFNYLMHYLSH
jgi:hypothetical protein